MVHVVQFETPKAYFFKVDFVTGNYTYETGSKTGILEQLKDCLPHFFYGFRNRHFNKSWLTKCYTFIINYIQVLRNCIDKHAMENNLQNKMQITFFLMASNNIDFDLVCYVNMYR